MYLHTINNMTRVRVGPYAPRRTRQRTGISAQLSLSPAPASRGVIYQRVHMSYKASSDAVPDVYRYTEAWVVNPHRKKTPVIDHDGRDSFLLCVNDINRFGGRLRVKAEAWFEEGRIDRALKKGKGAGLWGGLFGQMGHRSIPKGAPVLRRRIAASWAKGGDVSWSTA